MFDERLVYTDDRHAQPLSQPLTDLEDQRLLQHILRQLGLANIKHLL